MKLSEFKAKYFPWSKEYKAREADEKRAIDAYWEEVKIGRMNKYTTQTEQATSNIKTTKSKRKPLPYSYTPPQTVVQQPSSGSDMLMGALIGNAVSNAFSGHSHTNEAPVVERGESSSVFSSSDTSSDWGSDSPSSFDNSDY